MSKFIKSTLVGMLGSLVMVIIMKLAITRGIAPFQIPPSAAFLEKMGFNTAPLPLIAHFGYGATWSIILVYLAEEHTSLAKGLFVAIALWLFMMIVYSPLIGWGFFGFGGAEYAKDSPLYLEPGPKYLVATLVLHIIYGLIIGGLNPLWIDFE